MPWENDFLSGIGAPSTPTNIEACDLWAASEGTLSHNNPFAVSGHYPGATTCLAQCGTPSEVMAYSTMGDGIHATVSFIYGSYYTSVVDAFRQDAGLAVIYHAINLSPWCSGCQSGHYPIELYNAIQQKGILMTALFVNSQIHVWAEVNGQVVHWWQDTTGPNAGHWGKETMP